MADAPLTFVFPATGTALRDVRRRLEEVAGASLTTTDLHDLKLAVTEACANAVQHSGTREIRLSIRSDDSCIEVVVEDDGVYRVRLAAPSADPEAHRGLALMAALVDDLSLRRGTENRVGTVVTLRKCTS